jgi:type II secretory ATPase GspE/PulE/Tfp pilus assembly ATPase PilB-like protein
MLNDDIQREQKLKDIFDDARERNTQAKARSLGLPYLDLKKENIEPVALELVDEVVARNALIVPFQKQGDIVAVGVFDPNNTDTINVISQLKNQHFDVRVFVVSKTSLDFAFDKYKLVPPKREQISDFINVTNFVPINFRDLNEYLAQIDSSNVTKILSLILKSAIEIDASDIHIDALEKECLIRFRIDGILFDVGKISTAVYKGIRDRIKLLASIKLNVQNASQDGRFTIQNKAILFEARVSTIPGPYGEFIAIRLLNPERMSFDLQSLGLGLDNVKLINSLLSTPAGMILATGPTGSGKTTTLYALLKRKISPGINIITIEDPIEYKLKGINQTQVDEEKGYDFPNGLRAIVRQDPDVIMVGEIRDQETAEMAVQSSLTGHLVFSTLHTNEASGAISRLIEMGVDRDIIPDALKLIIAQRLVRKLCPYCKEKYKPSAEIVQNIKDTLSILSPRAGIQIPNIITELYRAKGCEKCNWLGYKGQTGLFELLFVNSDIADLVRHNASIDEIREKAISLGMVPLFHAGLLEVLQGNTSLEEITRVAGDIDYVKLMFAKILDQTLARGIVIDSKEISLVAKMINNLSLLETKIRDIKIADGFDLIFALALIYRASDIHIEPTDQQIVVRYRIDGVLEDKLKLPKELHKLYIQHIKNLAGLNVQVTDIVQEGRFKITEEGKGDRDCRVSIIPSGYGETVVLRILESNITTKSLIDLGMLPEFEHDIKQSISMPSGIVISCGPTSAGKTTTMYSILSLLNSPRIKIMTVEDPIEYRLPGVVQTQVNETSGYTFSVALRSFLRQNPNIILVGEIRDEETAKIAIQASLTGHLILSTLHTKDTATAISRLTNFQISYSDIAASLNTLIAQRLIRKLCPYCKKEISIPDNILQSITSEYNKLSPNLRQRFGKYFDVKIGNKTKMIYEPVGCEKCNYTGFWGQSGIFEILIIDEELRNIIVKGADINILQKEVQKRTLTLKQDGIIKVLQGVTN